MSELKEAKKEYSTKEKILREGLKLIQTKGYNGFSFKDIAESIGIRKASVHHHFKSKELLGVQVIEYYRNKLIDQAEEFLTRNIPTGEKLDGYFNFFLYWYNRGQRVCPAGVLTAEFSTLPESLQTEVKTLAGYNISWIERVLMEENRNGTFKIPGSPRDKAEEIATKIQGALLWGRMFGLSYLENIIEQTKKELIVR